MTDTLTGDIGSDNAAFATLSALSFLGSPRVRGFSSRSQYECYETAV